MTPDSCAPVREGLPMCVSGAEETLAMVEAYNAWARRGRGEAIPVPAPDDPDGLRQAAEAVQMRMWGRCGEDAACALREIGAPSRNLRAAHPESWRANPTAWLSNLDLERCLGQYAEVPANRMRFLGAVPSDFAEPRGPWGTCLVDRACATDMSDPFVDWYVLVANLDRSGMPGSHWVCLVVCTDDRNPNFGFTWFDSAGGPVIPGVQRFVDRTRERYAWLASAPARTLSPYRVQHGQTECGVHAILFALLLVLGAARMGGTVPADYIAAGITDTVAERARTMLFRSS